MRFLSKIKIMRLVWAVIPLVLMLALIGIIGVQDADATEPTEQNLIHWSLSNLPKLGETTIVTVTSEFPMQDDRTDFINVIISDGFEFVGISNDQIKISSFGWGEDFNYIEKLVTSTPDQNQTFTVELKAIKEGEHFITVGIIDYEQGSQLELVVGTNETLTLADHKIKYSENSEKRTQEILNLENLYENTTYDFSIKYPESWTATEYPNHAIYRGQKILEIISEEYSNQIPQISIVKSDLNGYDIIKNSKMGCANMISIPDGGGCGFSGSLSQNILVNDKPVTIHQSTSSRSGGEEGDTHKSINRQVIIDLKTENSTWIINGKYYFGDYNDNNGKIDSFTSLQNIINSFKINNYKYDWYSEIVQESTTTSYEIQSPKKQLESGVTPENVICREGLELIFKSSDNSPTCVKSSTAEKLIQRGWTLNPLFIEKCNTIGGTWNYEFNNCDAIFNPDKTITCEELGGTTSCMSREQHQTIYDRCTLVCEFK